MGYIEDLSSGSSPKVRGAAQKIIKDRISGHCQALEKALAIEVEKPKAWQSQSKLVRALGVADCKSAAPYLRKLMHEKYNGTIVYRELAFSIALLDDISADNLTFAYEIFEARQVMPIAGVCAAILYEEIVPSSDDIQKILSFLPLYTSDEGGVISPRMFIAAAAYHWPIEVVREFLNDCLQSESQTLIEIAHDVLDGKKPGVQLI